MKLLIIALVLLYSSILSAAESADSVTIQAQHMSVDHLHNQAEFKGGVHLIRGAFDLRCDRLLAYYQNNTLQRAEAFGRVRMQQGVKHGAAKHAIYNDRKHELTLLGAASVENKDGVIRGEKIIHNIKTENSQVVQGKQGRASLSLESDDMNKKVQP